ncbi:hypothetical protein EJ04DRAFT_543957 [Polyplosphaeria fusca]|uniref:MARVEL domain-containing protein n=1 Tax=Polyplosphaeria fusca TaxID=682080 RepID=A0A9P4QW52_9PLEO|nr:hypothetical protein EJ04DRAFT_543957 [Polyplosphaeria fusca]
MVASMAFKFFNKGSMKGEKPSSSSNFSIGSLARILIRLLQFVMGIVVIGLYATDLDKARKAGKYMDAKWVYAVFCGAFASLASLVFMLPLIKAWMFFFVDWLIWFFFLVLFGIFGKMYISEDAEGNAGIERMKRAVWIDLINLLLWLMTAVYGTIIFFKARKARSVEHVV